MKRVSQRTFKGFLRFFGNDVDNRLTPATRIVCDATTDYSVGAWVKLTRKNPTYANDNDSTCIFNEMLNWGSNIGYNFFIDKNKKLNIWVGNTVYSSLPLFPYNRLVHVAWTISGTTLKFYLNSVLIGTSTITRKAQGNLLTSKFFEEDTGAGANKRRPNGYITECFATRKCLTQAELVEVINGNLSNSILGAESVAYDMRELTGTSLVDATGNGNTGILLSATNAWIQDNEVNPKRMVVRDMGGSLNFKTEGADDLTAISVSNQDNLNQASLSFWLKPNQLKSSVNQFFFKKGNYWFTLNLWDKKYLYFKANWSGGLSKWSKNIEKYLKVGKWVNIVVTYDGSSVDNNPNIYINGILLESLVREVAPSGTRLADTNAIFIGCAGIDSGVALSKMCDVQYYNKILSIDEINNILYNGIVASGLVGHWKLNDGSGLTAIDSIGGANGTITGATYSTDAPIKLRPLSTNRFLLPTTTQKSVNFPGGGSKIVVTNDASLQLGTGDFCVAFWMKPKATGDFRILYKYNLNTSNGFAITYVNGGIINLVTYLGGNVANESYINKKTLLGKWIHYVAVRDNGVLKCYVNGVKQVVEISDTTNIDGTSNLFIGSDLLGAKNYIGGMKDLRILNRALTQSEITNLYYNRTIPTVLAGEWLFNEGEGTTAIDSSGNGNNGTITGATYSDDVPLRPRTLTED
jgi:hypothetical protein